MTKIGLFEVIHTAWAVRRFKPDPETLITEILDATIRAPSAGNAQNWAFLVVREVLRSAEDGRRPKRWLKSASAT